MSKITLVCTRSAISASALVYMINQSPDYYNTSHNNLWLNEISDKFGVAHTLNDWWNVPLSFTAYDKSIRNADVLDLKQLEHLSDNIKDINISKNIALFTHATNPAEIEKIASDHSLPINVVTTNMGHNSHYFVTSWLRREYNQIMNIWEDQERAWKNLMNHRTVKDSQWKSNIVLEMQDWLIDPSLIYKKLGINANHNIDIWLNEYRDKNGIDINSTIDECRHENNIGNITKLQVLLYLVNKFFKEGNTVNATQLYGYKLYADHMQNVNASYTELDTNVRNNL